MAAPNRAGLSAIAYRAGTHSSFVQRMLALLGAEQTLARLTTRALDDPAIALIDAWATVSDVLTFYQERIANEGFLRTATERRSVLELAREIGYELNPGVAANALLAFIVEDARGAPGTASLDSGLKVLSIPGQNERPQTFETVEALDARAEWNVLRPRTTEAQTLDGHATELFLDGMANRLEPGDALLLTDKTQTNWDVRFIQSVQVVPPSADLSREGYTHVTWLPPLTDAIDDARAFVFRQRAALFGYNAPDFRVMPDDIKAAFDPDAARRIAAGQRPDPTRTQWPDFGIATSKPPRIDLDAVYPRLLANSWVVLTSQTGSQLYHVDDVDPAARTDYTLNARVSRLTLDSSDQLSAFGLRDTLVLTQSEQLQLAERPATTPVEGSSVVLDRIIEGLHTGQRLVFTGRLFEDTDTPAAEASSIASITLVDGRTCINLAAPLGHRFDPFTLLINANVARATHGESVRNEVLGSGQGAAANQRFTLRKPPLTYVSAATPSGAQSTLAVRVDGVLWRQVPALFGLGPRDQGYTLRVQDDGQTSVIFGDGRIGARPTTGIENVSATYRSGIGLDGNVRANSLSLLQTRPLGIRGVSNPLPASGAAPPEHLDDARANAPLTVLTLDRVVSLRDFEDFARAFAGVGKAQATRLWDGQTHLAHLTVAGVNGGAVDPVATLPNLTAAIDAVRDPVSTVVIQNYTPLTFGVEAELLVDTRYVSADVLSAANIALREAFTFAQRSFGQAVSAAELITVVQSVPGVIAVNLTRLGFIGASDTLAGVPPFLPAASARWEGSRARPAELIVVDPTAIALSEMHVATA